MEKEKLEIVLEEVLEELKVVKSVVLEQKQQVWQLQERVGDVEKNLNGNKLMASPVDTRPVQSIITVAFAKIERMVADQPKRVVHERRFMLFPEHNGKEYYSVIFKLIMWLTVVSMGTYLFALGKQALENRREVQLQQLESNHYQHAWELMYRQETKKGKKKMEAIWHKSRLDYQKDVT